MSVLINMVMPKNCSECWALDEWWGDYPLCLITQEQGEFKFPKKEQRMRDCPLVEVPEPHGRLIDADALANDGWVLHKQVVRMGGYAIHELPLKNETIKTVIPASEEET